MSKDRDLNITSEDTQPKGFDEIPNSGKSKIPNELKPVETTPLPEIKLSFGEKIGRFFKGLEGVITKIFITVQQLPTVSQNFKFGAIVLLAAMILGIVLHFLIKS
jgi:hypothetical protein